MDPTETFNQMMHAWANGLDEEAAEHAANLLAWIKQGGFAPTIRIGTPGKQSFQLSAADAREFCEVVCRNLLLEFEQVEPPTVMARRFEI